MTKSEVIKAINVDEFELVTLYREEDGHIRVRAEGNRHGLTWFQPLNVRDDESGRAAQLANDLVREAVIDELADLSDAHCRVGESEVTDDEIERAVWNVTHNLCDPAEAARIVLDVEEVA